MRYSIVLCAVTLAAQSVLALDNDGAVGGLLAARAEPGQNNRQGGLWDYDPIKDGEPPKFETQSEDSKPSRQVHPKPNGVSKLNPIREEPAKPETQPGTSGGGSGNRGPRAPSGQPTLNASLPPDQSLLFEPPSGGMIAKSKGDSGGRITTAKDVRENPFEPPKSLGRAQPLSQPEATGGQEKSGGWKGKLGKPFRRGSKSSEDGKPARMVRRDEEERLVRRWEA